MIIIKKDRAERLRGDFSYFVSFPYSLEIVNVMRSLITKIYHPDKRVWEISESELKPLCDKLNDKDIPYICNEIKNPIIVEEPLKESFDLSILNNVNFKTEPYKYQKEGIVFGLNHPCFLLADEQGCVDENTIVQINISGASKKVSIKEAYRLFHTYKHYKYFKIRCLKDDHFGIHDVQDILYTGFKPCYKLTLESGKTIIATPDHEILTDKGFIELENLNIDKHKVIVNGNLICKHCGSTKNIITYPYAKFKGYCKKCMYKFLREDCKDLENKKLINGYWFLRGQKYKGHHLSTPNGVPEHQYIAELKYKKLLNLKKEVVHHKDYNSQNNDPDNLVILTIEEHNKLHSKEKYKHLYNHDYIKKNGSKIIVVPKQEQIRSVEFVGNKNVYDIKMKDPYHNFVANGIVVHNCGKSMQILNIAILRKEKEKFKHCLIITGYNTLKDNWLKEIEKHTNESGWIIGTRQKVKSGQVYVGDSKDKLQDLDNLSSNPHFFLITNVQSLQIVKKIKYGKKTRNEYIFADKINNLCKTNEIGMVIFDEFQVCKNITSLQTKALLRIKDSPNKVAATGTPIMNKAMDCYPLLSWLENKYINYKEFQDRYCVMGGFMNRQCIGDKNMHELHNRIKPLMLRRLKEDVLDLPDKVYIEDYLEMTDKQNLLYKQIKGETLLKISEAKKKKDLTIFTKLRQLTSHSCLATDDIQKCSSINDLIQYSQIFESIKFDRIKQLVEEISANNRKVIIFTNFKRAAYLLQDALKEYNPLAIHGDIKETSIRLKIVEQFQEKDNNKVLIGTIKAMGTGLTLTAASNVIFLDEPWNKALKDQCCDRCHRIGAKETIFIRTLICKNTLDEKINAIVKSKGALADMLIDGVPRDYEVFINYLFDL